MSHRSFLVDAQLEGTGAWSSLRLTVERENGSLPEDILLPILPNGRVQELVNLPDDASKLRWHLPSWSRRDATAVSLKAIGRLERLYRMAYRIAGTYWNLSREERRALGYSLFRFILDFSGLYRLATSLRCPDYHTWLNRFDTLCDAEGDSIEAHIKSFSDRHRVHILISVDEEGLEDVSATIASLRSQSYTNLACSVLDFSGTIYASAVAGVGSFIVVGGPGVDAWLAEFNRGLEESSDGDWVMSLRAGDLLPPHALYWLTSEILAEPEVAIVYGDDDCLDADGRRSSPRFKPDWSLTHLRSANYIGDAAILCGSAVAQAGGVSAECCRYGNYDLLLRVAELVGDKVAHVPVVMLHKRHRRGEAANESSLLEWRMKALRRHFERSGVRADVLQGTPERWRVKFHLPEVPPAVTIIIPTRDAVALVRSAVLSILQKSTYPSLEILIVDNQSRDEETLRCFSELSEHPRVRVVRYERSFNYSAINNFAVSQAKGEVICLLNNDTEVISPDWLEEMVGHLIQERVGVVGAKLYYPDGRVQHAGDAVGPGGCADHLHSLISGDEPGYCDRAVLAQELSAVTGACLVTWRNLYVELGGLDETNLKVAFNDVDYCLRVREAGFRVVWTPHAELYHRESVSRGKDTSLKQRWRASREVRYMRRKWAHLMKHDPFYNPNLSYERPDFSLSRVPSVPKPWANAVPQLLAKTEQRGKR